jgi:hypothetical protein
MTKVRTRIRIAADGTLSGRTHGIPVGEHDAEIIVADNAASGRGPDAAGLLARVRAIQAEIARLPVLDERSAEEILGYNERGHFD